MLTDDELDAIEKSNVNTDFFPLDPRIKRLLAEVRRLRNVVASIATPLPHAKPATSEKA